MGFLVAGLVIVVGYAVAAILFALPIYLLVAIFRDDLDVIPSDHGDAMFFLVIAGAFYVFSLLSAPGRLRST